MKRSSCACVALVFSLLISLGPAVAADNTIKVGVVAASSGPFAQYGKQIAAGIKTYMKIHGDTVAGKKVEVIYRDSTGAPEVAKRVAQELVVRDKVDFLAGFVLTPEALAVADVATQSKKPMIVMNAAASVITQKSPYVVRVSMTLPQVTEPLAKWAAKNGIKKVYTLVSDYAPGLDAEKEFKADFTAAGGQIVDSVRVPLKNPEFAPYIQRIKDAKPDAAFVFLPAGAQGIAFMKAFTERGLAQAGIKVIATGDITEDHVLDQMGDSALGMITTHHYSEDHSSPENKAFLKAFAEVAPDDERPDFMAVAAYDGMGAIYDVAKKLGGKIDGDKAVAALAGMKIASPRGTIRIDPETRDVVQTVYVRRVQKKKDGHYYNVEFDKFADVKDPVKAAKK